MNPARGTFLSADVKGLFRGMLTESASAHARTAVVTVYGPSELLARPIHTCCKGPCSSHRREDSGRRKASFGEI